MNWIKIHQFLPANTVFFGRLKSHSGSAPLEFSLLISFDLAILFIVYESLSKVNRVSWQRVCVVISWSADRLLVLPAHVTLMLLPVTILKSTNKSEIESGGVEPPDYPPGLSMPVSVRHLLMCFNMESMLLHHIETHYTTGLGLLLYPVTA